MAFDIREQTDRSSAVTPDDVDLEAFRDRSLSVPTLRCLRYVAGIECHTVGHHRGRDGELDALPGLEGLVSRFIAKYGTGVKVVSR